MDILKFGLKQWNKNVFGAILIQLLSWVAVIADLLLPLLAGMLLNYIIKGEPVKEGDGGVFGFL